MSWEDRIQQAAFTSSSGVRIEFQFENVSASINKRDSIREFPDFAGALVQNFGVGVTSVPLLCVFSGENHDLEADDFLNILAEEGLGILEHPLYGRFENIVAFGVIARRDDLVTAANQTKFEVNFVQSAAFKFPGSIQSANDQISFDLAAFDAAQADSFDQNIKIIKAQEQISLIDSVKAKLDSVNRFMSKIVATVDEIENEFNDAISLVQNNINNLIGTPLALAQQIINIVKLPARAASQIGATLSAYENLFSAVISDANRLFSPAIGNSVNNQFFNSELYSNASFAGMLTAAQAVAASTSEISGQSLEEFISIDPESRPGFTTKSDIISTIDFLRTQFEVLVAWNEANRIALGLLDTDESYSALNRAWSSVSGFLIQISFSARQEREIVLGSPRNMIELCGELYGVLDSAFDFFILTNDLSGDEIFEMPRGRRIKYYV